MKFLVWRLRRGASMGLHGCGANLNGARETSMDVNGASQTSTDINGTCETPMELSIDDPLIRH